MTIYPLLPNLRFRLSHRSHGQPQFSCGHLEGSPTLAATCACGGPSDTPSFILALRDARDNVRLVEINALTARLIELLREGRRSGQEALLDLAAEARYLDLTQFIPFGEHTLRQLQDQGAILGTQSPATAPTI